MIGVARLAIGTPVEIRRRSTGGWNQWERGAAKFSHYAGAHTVVEWPGGRFEHLPHQDVRAVPTTQEPAE